MKERNFEIYKSIQELNVKHDIMLDVDNKIAYMKKETVSMLQRFSQKAFLMKFCADEHLTGRKLYNEA